MKVGLKPSSNFDFVYKLSIKKIQAIQTQLMPN
jgi:hypothetical protein